MNNQIADQFEYLYSKINTSGQLWVGGNAVSREQFPDLPQNCILMRDLDEFNQHLSFLRARPG